MQDDSELVCGVCGTVIEAVLNMGQESNTYTPGQANQKVRTGAPINLRIHDGGLATVIGGSRSGSRRVPDAEAWQRVNYLRKWNQRVRIATTPERTLAAGLSELTKLCTALSLPSNVRDTASVVYRRAIKRRLIRGRSIVNVSAAAVYLSCRQCGVPRTLDQIATLSGSSKKEIGRAYRLLFNELNVYVPPSARISYAAMFVNRLSVSGKAERIAINILNLAKEMRLTSGRGPAGIAAASTYIATVVTNERKTQREIAEMANVTEVTIRNRYKELLENLICEVPL